jgi:hypothetical protein
MLPIPDKPLAERFSDFLNSREDVENIDALPLQRNPSKADYFAEKRGVIIELKSLETDTEHRIEEILKPHRSRPEFPDFFGGWDLRQVLLYLPDGEEIGHLIAKVVTDSIERLFRKANSQIRSTKYVFGLPDATGLLILLNQHIDVLSPNLIIYRLRKAAGKRHPDGALQFTEIQHVMLISEAHYNPGPNNSMGFLILHQPLVNGRSFGHDDFLHSLGKSWSQYNNAPLKRV